ncbi:MAG: hypothetical protein L0I24_12755, partial [Pseudonocardia sp.]|nr:hypothetical protein [Pseudonocardia sp.]
MEDGHDRARRPSQPDDDVLARHGLIDDGRDPAPGGRAARRRAAESRDEQQRQRGGRPPEAVAPVDG